MIRSYFDRWGRLEDDKAALAEDSKELFAEAKSNGFNTKAMRAAFRRKRVIDEATPEDAAKNEQEEAEIEAYLTALITGAASIAAFARARPAGEDNPSHPPDSGPT